MGNFDNVFDSYSSAYSELESVMIDLYDVLKADPTNEKNAEMFERLGNVGLKLISSQRELVESYADNSIRDFAFSMLDNKESVLTDAISEFRYTRNM